jgi:phosphoribosylformimino-5-aminoimidazole carboxamide ribonucleotide (ProFAR) isomerase
VVGDDIPVQLGGGIRDLDTIERYLDNGISYVIIGTAAVKNPGFLHDACTAFPGTSSSAWTPRTARSRSMAGPSSPATTWSTWRRSSRTTASSR